MKFCTASTALLLILAFPPLAAAEPEAQPDAIISAEQETELLARLDAFQRALSADLSRDLDQRLAQQSAIALTTAFQRRIARVADAPGPASIAPRRTAHRGGETEVATQGNMRCTQGLGQRLECRVFAAAP